MKLARNILLALVAVLILASIGLSVSGNGHLFKGIYATYLHGENSATIGDKKYFDTRTVEKGDFIPWEKSASYNQKSLPKRLDDKLQETESIAFLVIKDGKLDLEHYWRDGSEDSKTNSFSVAKTIVSMLVGTAIQDGYIEGVMQPVADFFPEWSQQSEYNKDLQIQHLLTMCSSLDWDESYKNPFSITAKAYYGDDIENLMLSLNITDTPGERHFYQSGNTQLLGMLVARATKKSLSEYASEKLWQPLGAAYEAEWHLDTEDGTELAYCCFNTNAQDFARLGQLYLNEGNWHGKQLVNDQYVDISTKPAKVPYYGYSWWLAEVLGEKVFYARGILGQYIIVVPEKDLVIVRLGHKRGKHIDAHTDDFYTYVEEVITMYSEE